jgi:ankyrin repeat protein
MDSFACHSLLWIPLNSQVTVVVDFHFKYKIIIPVIFRYLIEHNADVAAVNNDGELPIDIAETEAMEELLDRETQLRGNAVNLA